MGVLIVVIVISGIAYSPLYFFKEGTIVGTYIRANAPLISILSGESFIHSLSGKKASSLMAAAFIIYASLSLSELIRRRGTPLIEWSTAIAALIFFHPTPENRYIFFLIVSAITFTFAYSEVWKKQEKITG